MFNNILEISKRASKGGRTPIKIALLKIHEYPEETNENGLHWKEEYVLNAIDSAKMMPICAEFLSEAKDIPFGHGLTGTEVNEKGISEPQFLNSETVGVIETASIETIKDGDTDIKALCGSGYLFSQRYPALTKWVRKNYAEGKVDTSVEIMGTELNNNQIIYEEEQPTESFRTPMDFLFSGTAILSISPADPSAIVLEVAQRNNQNKEEPNMDFTIDDIKSAVQSAIAEVNSANGEFETKISELNSAIAEKDGVIAEKDQTISELNASIEQVKKALADLEAERDTYWAEKDALIKELGELKAKARLGELNSAIKSFTDEEKKFAESEINSFNEKPLDGDINAIVAKIYAGIGQAAKKAEDARVAELNNRKNETNVDIFSEMFVAEPAGEPEDVNIF